MREFYQNGGRGNKYHLKALGQRILSELNDLKRTSLLAAEELNVDHSCLNKVIEGKSDYRETLDMIDKIVLGYPILLTDIWVEPDDTNEGVILMRARESELSSRIINRYNSSAELAPYYEYRDTAMCRTAPFKPEWIKVLRSSQI